MTRVDVANYLNILITIYSILIFVRIVLTWIPQLANNTMLRGIIQFVHDVTEPYLAIFRKLIPPVGGTGFALDLSPLVALLVLQIGGQLLVGLILP